MIVRKYGRRNRSITGTNSDSGFDDVALDGLRDSLSQESPRDVYDFGFSSQDSFQWVSESDPYGLSSSQELGELAILPPRKPVISENLEDCDGVFRKSKKPRNGKSREIAAVPAKKLKSKTVRSVPVGPSAPTATAAATLMETQEFGEMMEHVDEVNFALDGLRKGQPVRIRRASLLSLLSICGTAPHRRLLRAHGMAKTIIDAVLGLSFDDSPSNLAAATLFYVLTSDGEDDNLLDSPNCIRFLIRLLRPITSYGTKDKMPTIGSKLLALCKDADTLKDANKGIDSTSTAITLKVQEILFSFKEMKSKDGNPSGMDRAKLNPKWISLLTMEKACLSKISLEDTCGTMRETGCSFKEKLRELGGLEAVFEVARNCHSIMEGWLGWTSSSNMELKDIVDPESLMLLSKCLKIMENATFLSTDNQSHLLGMKGNIDCHNSPTSFIRLILSVIKILSGVSLLENSSHSSKDDEIIILSNGTSHAADMPLEVHDKVADNEIISISSSVECCGMESTTSQKSFNISLNGQWRSAGQFRPSKSSSEATTASLDDTCLLRMRIDSSTSGSCSGTARSSYHGIRNNGSGINFGLGKRSKVNEDPTFEPEEDSMDPFAFHDDDFEPSKWDILSGTQKVSQIRRASVKEHENGCQSVMVLSQQESSNTENRHIHEASCSSTVEEKSNLLAECLLTAVKVLMNLTNDNPVGCQQIAVSGGLETLSSLIGVHFPSLSSYWPLRGEPRENNLSPKSSVEVGNQNGVNLTDQELDFLVAILGLLVNLVEKDGRNRARLAAASVSLPSLEGLKVENHRDVIPLLCSIFLANQGAGEAAGEGNHLQWDDEDAVLQGEREAEKMIVEAYAALLLAFLSTESKSIRDTIADCLPAHNLAILVPVLERFVEFHLTLNMISPETHRTVLEVIESCRVP